MLIYVLRDFLWISWTDNFLENFSEYLFKNRDSCPKTITWALTCFL